MASKAKNHFKALASSSSVPELAASSMRDSTSTCAFAYPAMQACGTSKSMAQGFTAHSRTVRLSMACQPMRESLGAVLGSGGSGCSSLLPLAAGPPPLNVTVSLAADRRPAAANAASTQ